MIPCSHSSDILAFLSSYFSPIHRGYPCSHTHVHMQRNVLTHPACTESRPAQVLSSKHSFRHASLIAQRFFISLPSIHKKTKITTLAPVQARSVPLYDACSKARARQQSNGRGTYILMFTVCHRRYFRENGTRRRPMGKAKSSGSGMEK